MSDTQNELDALSASLSKYSLDEQCVALVNGVIAANSAPYDAARSFINLVSTLSMLVSPAERLAVVDYMRDVAGEIEATLTRRTN